MNTFNTVNMKQEMQPKIGTTFRGGGNGEYRSHSILVTIPATMTHQYGLENPTNVIFVPREDGILIKKLEVVK